MNPSTTLFLGDLSAFCSEHELYNIFETFGSIESIQLKGKTSPHSQPTFGFITYRFHESAERALQVMDGQIVGGRAIR